MPLNFSSSCPEKIRKMSLKVLECPAFKFLNLFGHHGTTLLHHVPFALANANIVIKFIEI